MDIKRMKSGTWKKKKMKTKFEEFLEMETGISGGGQAAAAEDLAAERRLARKLGIKRGRLGGAKDELGEILDGLPSYHDDGKDEDRVEEEKPAESSKERKRRRKKKEKVESEEGLETRVEEEMDGAVTNAEEEEEEVEHVKEEKVKVVETSSYVAPHLRARMGGESEEVSQVRRRVRGLLNRLSESNVESITQEVAEIFRSVGRSVGCKVIGEEVVASCSRGPRGNEQYAAVFASFVAGMACLVGIDFSARLLESIAKSFEDEYLKEDSSSLRNLSLLLSYLCIFGICSSDLIYDLLSVLSKRLTELDVATILAILQCCGMKLRGDDPTAMKDFVLSIQQRVNEVKALSDREHDEKLKINSKRMEFMLETICDIKNNKKRSKEDPAHHTRIKKWLQKLRADDILLRGLKWSKLLDPEKKGQWWISGDMNSAIENVKEVASTIKKVPEAQKLVQLAAAQRMNTDIRRAIFCIIMSSEDYIDAFEKILRLDLSGKQDREIMRVLVDCCLQEKVFNKYYTVLASKLCSHDKNHRFTLQYCIWDHFKELESMELTRSMNLARFVAEMLSSFTLSLSLLKAVDLSDLQLLTSRKVMHFRMLFESVFENKDDLVWNIFTRVAGVPELEALRDSLMFFIKKYVVAANQGKSFTDKFKIAKKALHNQAGILM